MQRGSVYCRGSRVGCGECTRHACRHSCRGSRVGCGDARDTRAATAVEASQASRLPYGYARSMKTISPWYNQSPALFTRPPRTGVWRNVIPFRTVTFVAAQDVIKESGLPKFGRLLRYRYRAL